MKPRNREINIFNLSMLDVISGAMGAFLIIMVVLFPFYKKESIDYQKMIQESNNQLADVQRQIIEQQQQLIERQQQSQQQQQELQQAQTRLASIRFLIVSIKWDTENQDIDLHVIDPTGAEFYFDKRTVPGRPGELTEDDTKGPGKEVWEIISAPAGLYRVYANLYDRNGNNIDPKVSGRIFHRDGIKELDHRRLTNVNQKILLVSITVKTDGSVIIQ